MRIITKNYNYANTIVKKEKKEYFHLKRNMFQNKFSVKQLLIFAF